MASVGELKESLVESLVTLWKQWTKTKERLQESRRLDRSQKRGNVLLRDGGLMRALAGRGEKKQEAIGVVLQIMAVPLEEAMLLRDNILFQMLELRDEMLANIQSSEELVEVWRTEVVELLAWKIRGGELEDGEEEAEAEEDVQVEDVPDDVEEEEEVPAKERSEEKLVEVGGEGEQGGGVEGEGGGLRKDLGGGLWGVKEPKS